MLSKHFNQNGRSLQENKECVVNIHELRNFHHLPNLAPVIK